MSTKQTLGTLALCAMGAFGGFAIFELSLGGGPNTATPVTLGSVEAARARPAAEDSLRPASRLEPRSSVEPAAASVDDRPTGSGEGSLEPWQLEPLPIPVPEDRFLERYAGYSVEELDQSFSTRMSELGFSCMSAFRERHEAGLSVWREFQNSTDSDGDGSLDAEPRFRLKGRSNELFVMAGTDQYGDEHRPYVVWLPVDQYPDLYEMRDELNWLRRERARLAGSAIDMR